MKFSYRGLIPASKSLMIRALISKSFQPDIDIKGQSDCDDVVYMTKAIQQIGKTQEFDCGEAGAVLRFLALRLSREKGVFVLKGSERLFSRPQEDLLFILDQLGVSVVMGKDQLTISGQGWQKPLVPLRVHREKSSQFSSALILSAWELPFDLEFDLVGPAVSDSYFQMTLEFAKQLGLVLTEKPKGFSLRQGQKLEPHSIDIEPDYSSMFSVAAAAALCGEAHFEGITNTSLQPDFQFIDWLKAMGVPMKLTKGNQGPILEVGMAPKLKATNLILRDNPDLFPVLSVLCAFAHGKSLLAGAPHLIHKESNRIARIQELLTAMGVQSEKKEQGLQIEGAGADLKPKSFTFDADQDHRLAMAAGLLVRKGWPVTVQGHRCVKKSFPGFWKALGLEK